MKKIYLVLGMLFCSILMLRAQDRTVSGKVTSAEDGSPLPGVNVVVKGTTNGTTTDIDGNYKLSVPSDGGTLLFSFIGMKTVEEPIGARSVIDVALKSDVQELQEVVVTAIGIKKSSEKLGYAASKISSDQLNQAKERSMLNAMQGKVPGVNIRSASGSPGASTRIVIRGYNSINQSIQPLFVIDGVPMNNSTTGSQDLNGGLDFGNGVNSVNPEDIKDVTVLKGAAATALYGSRGANGVIVITTKNGQDAARKGKGAQVTYSGTVTFDEVLRLPQFQNTFGEGYSGQHRLNENTSWGPMFDGKDRLWGRVNRFTNAQKIKPYEALPSNIRDFFDVGVTQQHNVSVAGGDDNTNYYVSYSNLGQDGVFPTDADSYNRNTVAIRAGQQFNDAFRVDASFNYVKEKINAVSTGQQLNAVLNNLFQTPRDIPVKELQDYHNGFNDLIGYYTEYGLVNPYYALHTYKNQADRDRFFGNISLNYDFNNWLGLTLRTGGDFRNEEQWSYAPKIALDPMYANSAQNAPGTYSETDLNFSELNSDLFLTANNNIGENFQMRTIIGWNLNQRRNSRMFAAVSDLTIPGFYNLSNGTPSGPPVARYQLRRYAGVYANVDLNYKTWLSLGLVARNDWSSTLPKESRSFFYPGINGSFIFTDAFGIGDGIMNFGKVRASWAQAGNDATPYSVYPFFRQASHFDGFTTFSYPLVNGQNAFEEDGAIGNPNLQPEITTEYEFGTNLQFFNNRINLDLTYYNRKTSDLIFSVSLPPTTGFSSQTLNIGGIRNQGVEAQLNVKPIQTNNFKWNIGINFSKNNNKLESLTEGLDEVQLAGFGSGFGTYAIPGESLGQFKNFVPLRDKEGHIIVDEAGQPRISTDSKVVASAQEDFLAGLTNTFSYKGITLNVTVDWRKGGWMYSRTRTINEFAGASVNTLYNMRRPFIIPNSVYQPTAGAGQPADANGRLVDDNGDPVYVENTIPLTMSNNGINTFITSNGFGEDKAGLIPRDFVKLREVSLSYTLPSKWLNKVPVSKVSVSAVGRNLLLWTPADNRFADPEQTTFGQGLAADFGDYGATPTTRQYGFNLNVTF